MPKHFSLTGALLLLLITFVSLIPHTQALLLLNRSVSLASATPSTVTNHTFKFTPQTSSNISSIVFEYCDNSPLFSFACTIPSGLDTSAASLSSQSGNTGFSIDNGNTTSNKIVLT